MDTISQCSSGVRSWQYFLDQLVFFCSPLKVGITSHDHQQNFLKFALLSGYDPDYIDSYNQHFHRMNPWVPALANAPLPPDLMWAYDALPDEVLKKTEFYHDWVRPQEDAATGFAIALVKGKDRFITMNCNINYKYIEKAEDLAKIIQIVGPSLQRGFEVWRRLQGQSVQLGNQEAILNRMKAAVFILDEDQKISFANLAADKLLQQGNVVKTDSAKQLYFLSSIDQNAVFPQLGKNADIIPCLQRQADDGYIKLTNPEQSPYVALVSSFDYPNHQAQRRFAYGLQPERQNILMLINPAAEKNIDQASIIASFGLTPAQAKIAGCLVRGMTLKEAAVNSDIAYTTAKSHLKNATETMGVNSQAKLILQLSNIANIS